MKELVQDVIKWADDKGILSKATLTTQCRKMEEEVEEVAECINILDHKEIGRASCRERV